MRSFLAAALALGLASLVSANPNPEPNNVITLTCGALGGQISGSCPTGYNCEKGTDKKYSCVKPVCSAYVFGTCPTGQECVKGSDNKYCCKTPPPPVCGGIKMGTCPKGSTCKAGPRSGQYSCVADGPVPSGKIKTKRAAFCAEGSVACPVKGNLHGFECINIKSNIEQCGDCAVLGGVDCSALPGVDSVSCVNGFCKVEACVTGFAFDFRKKSCVPNSMWSVQADN
ncbi:hypothetical protein JCM3765_001471 [Sporobolomyces pararoseus]